MRCLADRGVLCVLAATVGALALMVGLTGSPFTYPLDDTYIHLAVARTLATSGVWGIQALDPAAASSSPLFTCLLALVHLLTGGHGFLYAPLAINAIAIVLTVGLWAGALDGHPHRTVVLALLSLGVPLAVIGFVGMEHSLQVFLTTALVIKASKSIAKRKEDMKDGLLLLALALCAVAIRYESLAIVVSLMAFALSRRQWRMALLMGAGAALPVVLFGLLWMHNGGWMLPNPVLIKPLARIEAPAHLKPFISFFANAFTEVSGLMLVTLLAGTITGLSQRARRRVDAGMNDWRWIFGVVTVFATVGQLVVGKVGWLYRYEAWLVALNTLAIVLTWGRTQCRTTFAATASLLLAFGLVRTGLSTKMAAESPLDRWHEHGVPATFIAKHYAGQVVLANDIGHMAWTSPSTRVLDLYGLGNNEAAAMRIAKRMGPESVAAWATRENASIAVVQICWPEVANNIPNDWRLAALWRIPRNVAFGDMSIGFFAVGADKFATLSKALHDFEVPQQISVTYPEDPTSRLHGFKPEDLRAAQPHQECP